MFAFSWPDLARARPRCAVICRALTIAAAGTLLSGCIVARGPSGLGQGSSAWPGTVVQPAAVVRTSPPHVEELEDDGLPVQTAPLRREQTGPDDPSEPFSPNYGPPTRSASWRTLDDTEADLTVSRAMAAHERIYP